MPVSVLLAVLNDNWVWGGRPFIPITEVNGYPPK
jgi:hypothetical protein